MLENLLRKIKKIKDESKPNPLSGLSIKYSLSSNSKRSILTSINLYLLKPINIKGNHILVNKNINHILNSTLLVPSPSKQPKITKIPHNIYPTMIISKINNKIPQSNNQYNTKIKDQEL